MVHSLVFLKHDETFTCVQIVIGTNSEEHYTQDKIIFINIPIKMYGSFIE